MAVREWNKYHITARHGRARDRVLFASRVESRYVTIASLMKQ